MSQQDILITRPRMPGKTTEMVNKVKSFFPLKIEYLGDKEPTIVFVPENIKSGKSFRVLEYNTSVNI